jgi:hypothetical protein
MSPSHAASGAIIATVIRIVAFHARQLTMACSQVPWGRPSFFVICPAAQQPLAPHPEGESVEQLEAGMNKRQSGLRETSTAGFRIKVAGVQEAL